MLYDILLNNFNSSQNANEPAEMQELRQSAWAAFRQNNFPSVKNEEYRFTNIQPFVNEQYALELPTQIDPQKAAEAVKALSIKDLDAYRIVIINGSINFDHSLLPEHDEFVIHQIADLLQEKDFAQKLNYQLPVEKFPFAAVNTAFFKNGYFYDVKKDCDLDKPVHIMHIFSGGANSFVQPRNLVYLEKGSKTEIIESFICLDEHAYLINSVTEIHVEPNAHCSHVIFQKNRRQHRFITHLQITQQQDSYYDNYTITIPESQLVRNNLNVILEGKNTETHMYGLYLPGEQQLVDNHSLVEHRQPHCHSNQLYKGVILDGGRGVFNGKIHVFRPAQKTNAFQQNNNLLFSPNAQVNTKPQLEIFADDVKCSHGSTIGQFNKESLFYLQTRGISEKTARTMLVNAFAFDVTQKLANQPLRNYIDHLIESTINEAENR